jgi:hypothetical protein
VKRYGLAVAPRPAPKRELWQLCVRLSTTFAIAGVLLGVGGHWTLAYVIFAVGVALAAIAGALVWRRDRQGKP